MLILYTHCDNLGYARTYMVIRFLIKYNTIDIVKTGFARVKILVSLFFFPCFAILRKVPTVNFDFCLSNVRTKFTFLSENILKQKSKASKHLYYFKR